MSNLNTLKTVINEKINWLTWIWQILVDYFPYHTMQNNWFPYATCEFTNLESEELDSCTNLRNYQFDILIFQEVKKIWREKAKEILDDSFVAIINAFDIDYTLWGEADWWILAVWWEAGQIVWENWETLFANIKLNVKITKNINI